MIFEIGWMIIIECGNNLRPLLIGCPNRDELHHAEQLRRKREHLLESRHFLKLHPQYLLLWRLSLDLPPLSPVIPQLQ